MRDPSLVRFRAVVDGALSYLESRRQEINDLNVFPVADGDTGDNMALTLTAVRDELDRLHDLERPLDEIGRGEIVASVARAALLGARGNSGVILSQLIAGAADVLIEDDSLVSPELLGAAMAEAADRAYRSVRRPAEGTMLTVMRKMATAIALELPHLDESRFDHGVDPGHQNALLADVLERALAVGEEAVRRGPEVLPALKEHGVVDAGGHAVTIVFAGVIAALRGTGIEVAPERYAPAAVRSHPEHESSTYRYCVNFAVTGRDLDADLFTERLEAIGDSVLVVGDRATLRVHVHADDFEAAQALFDAHGTVSHVEVADMRDQVADRQARMQRCAAVAVCVGQGMARLFREAGALPLDSGRSMNPSTQELLAAIHEVTSEEVVLLPNSPNVVMAAERAAELSEKDVRVVGSRSMQAGLAALSLGFSPDGSAEENAAALERELGAVRTGGVAPAAREDPQGRYGVGDAVGFVDDALVAWGTPREALEQVLADLREGSEYIACFVGDGAPLDEAELAALLDPELGEVKRGDQPAWWYLLGAE